MLKSMNAAHTAPTTSTADLFHIASTRLFTTDGTRSLERQHLAGLLAGQWGVIGDALLGVSFRHNRTQAEIKACAAACREAATFIATMYIDNDDAAELAADFRNGLFIAVDRCRAQTFN